MTVRPVERAAAHERTLVDCACQTDASVQLPRDGRSPRPRRAPPAVPGGVSSRWSPAVPPHQQPYMYAQMIKTDVKALKALEDLPPDERAFQARVDADVRIEREIELGDFGNIVFGDVRDVDDVE